jgi:hypothetical protein
MGKNNSLSKSVRFVNFRKCEIHFQSETKKVNMKIWGPPDNACKLNAIYHSICSRPGKKNAGVLAN